MAEGARAQGAGVCEYVLDREAAFLNAATAPATGPSPSAAESGPSRGVSPVRIVEVDRSAAMLRTARHSISTPVVRSGARIPPIATGSIDAVVGAPRR
jgi:hypothetical protein